MEEERRGKQILSHQTPVTLAFSNSTTVEKKPKSCMYVCGKTSDMYLRAKHPTLNRTTTPVKMTEKKRLSPENKSQITSNKE